MLELQGLGFCQLERGLEISRHKGDRLMQKDTFWRKIRAREWGTTLRLLAFLEKNEFSKRVWTRVTTRGILDYKILPLCK